jgi:hypothetical protein
MSLDSSILISHLAGDVHKEAVLAAIEHLDTMGAELTLPLLCYAEIWTGIELSTMWSHANRRQRRSGISYRLAAFCWSRIMS